MPPAFWLHMQTWTRTELARTCRPGPAPSLLAHADLDQCKCGTQVEGRDGRLSKHVDQRPDPMWKHPAGGLAFIHSAPKRFQGVLHRKDREKEKLPRQRNTPSIN